jgi:hypothetical protein
MTYSSPKRFNAQRAARRELGNPNAEEGMDFITEKNAAGEWTYRVNARSVEHAQHAEVTCDQGTEGGCHPCTEAIVEPAPAALDVTDISLAEMRGDDLREPEKVRAQPKRKPRVEAAASEPRADSKSAIVVARATASEGITNKELREITGWTKLGGFFGAVKRKGLVLRRLRENGDTRWFAEAPKT